MATWLPVPKCETTGLSPKKAAENLSAFFKDVSALKRDTNGETPAANETNIDMGALAAAVQEAKAAMANLPVELAKPVAVAWKESAQSSGLITPPPASKAAASKAGMFASRGDVQKAAAEKRKTAEAPAVSQEKLSTKKRKATVMSEGEPAAKRQAVVAPKKEPVAKAVESRPVVPTDRWSDIDENSDFKTTTPGGRGR